MGWCSYGELRMLMLYGVGVSATEIFLDNLVGGIWTLAAFRYCFPSLAAIYCPLYLGDGLMPTWEPQEQCGACGVLSVGAIAPGLILPLVPIFLACCKGKCMRVCKRLGC